jgi:hypothetical protein
MCHEGYGNFGGGTLALEMTVQRTYKDTTQKRRQLTASSPPESKQNGEILPFSAAAVIPKTIVCFTFFGSYAQKPSATIYPYCCTGGSNQGLNP